MTDFWETLATRKSLGPKHQKKDTVLTDEARAKLARITARVPSHGAMRSRLIEVTDREALAHVMAGGAEAALDPELWAKAREKAAKGALCWMLVVEKMDAGKERDEALITAGALLMRLLDGLHALGLAAKTVTAKDFTEGAGLFDPTNESVAAFVLAGEPLTQDA